MEKLAREKGIAMPEAARATKGAASTFISEHLSGGATPASGAGWSKPTVGAPGSPAAAASQSMLEKGAGKDWPSATQVTSIS